MSVRWTPAHVGCSPPPTCSMPGRLRRRSPSDMQDGPARKGALSSPGSARSPTLLIGCLLTDWIRSRARDVRNIWNPWSIDTSDRSEHDRAHHHINRRTAMITAAAAGQPVLELTGIGKDFGAIRALHDVDMQVFPGEVVGLMGDNGAGKSTLVKVIAGNFPANHGEIRFEGNTVHFHRPIDARAVRIEVVYQDLALADNLTAAANVFLGRELKRKFGPLSLLDHKAMAARALELFGELRSETRSQHLVKQMPGGQRQAVAIARTRLSNARLVMMDEPTAAISVRQVEQVLSLIHRLQEQGVAVMLISHRMPDVFAVCDRVIVLRRGEKRADKPIRDTSPEEVTALITGAKEAA